MQFCYNYNVRSWAAEISASTFLLGPYMVTKQWQNQNEQMKLQEYMQNNVSH